MNTLQLPLALVEVRTTRKIGQGSETLTLLDALQRGGVQLKIEGERLAITAPAPLEPEILGQLRQHKSEILELLSAPDAAKRRNFPPIFYPRAAYDPRSAQQFALSDDTLTPAQRAFLLAYAAQAAQATGA